MRVEKLELIGFKSFSDRTVFHLHPGITCIVGPNGCGKSNIVDSFKWVLGEQSAKSMRGEKMEEVIFSGSQTRKPKGMAEVSLHVSGMGGEENGKGALVVTRRLYRSGDSEYMLNRSACRLRDIKDIFLDTGLEVKSYSILEQDRISAILSAKPEERRFLIEEVAGVVKYKVRRNEAQSKLESSRHNLQRIGDVVSEVKRQINYLDRQVKKAERFKRLVEEIKEIELKMAREDYLALGSALREAMSGIEALREEVALKKARLTQAENEIETRRIALLEREKALEAVQSALQEAEREIADLERALAVSAAEVENLREYAVKLRLQEEENRAKRAESLERQGEIAGQKEALRAEMGSLESEMSARRESLAASQEEMARSEEGLEAMRREAFRVSDGLSQLRNEHQRLLSAMENLERREAALAAEASELRGHMEETGRARDEARLRVASMDGEAAQLAGEKEALAGEIEAGRQRLEGLRSSIALEREELASASSRLESLREMVYSESTAEALKGEDLRLLASISDIIEVPREYERAIESALREKINGFILPAYEDVRLAVRAVKEKEAERTALIPLNGSGPWAGGPAAPEGAIAMASELVRVREDYAGAVKGLLRDVAVVGDLDAAIGLAASGGALCYVTLEGETVEPSGVVIAGKSRGLLALKRQIRELEAEAEGRRAAVARGQAEMDEAAAAVRAREEALAAAGQRLVECEKELSVLRHRADALSQEMERAEKKLSFLAVEAGEAAGEREKLRGLIEEKESAIRGLEEEKRRVEEGIARLQEELSGKRSAFEEERSQSVDLRLSLNSCRERLASLEKEEQSLARLLSELSEKEGFIAREAAGTEGRMAERKEEAALKEAALREAVVKAEGLRSAIAAERDVMGADSDALVAEGRGLRALRTEIEAASERLSQAEVRRAEHALRMDNLAGNIRNAYGVELETLEAGEVTEEERERLPALRKKLEELGPVSLGSLEEYQALKERYDFLTGQQEDLQKSIAELEEAIAKINSTTRKKLREAFQALRDKFSEVFTAVFGGGRAELVLTDEGNILETGIDVIAQPPGKRLQNINLLSGGEKSLTALALLFSSFLIKPTPLCILDEADAALDEANTGKFAQLVKELSRDIQFVVVTHNRVTMEAADHIYGITMEEPGASKVLSMQLADA
ncbi:MAG: chromosome segregation protein SMC [Thermodesulfovibrionales bacterium]